MKTAPAPIVSLVVTAMIILSPAANSVRQDGNVRNGGCGRIISLAPNITETLYALGMGERVVGVTRFCSWPPEADEKPEVGGYLDSNLEAIVSLEPDLVVMLPVHERIRDFLDGMGIECLVLANETIPDILRTIRSIGMKCRIEERAGHLADSLETAYKSSCPLPDAKRPGVLIVVDREYGAAPEKIYAAGKGTWYDELLSAAGGRNVLENTTASYPMLSPESLMYLSPDVIVEIVPGAEERGLSAASLVSDWKTIDLLDSVSSGKVHILTGKHAAVPGPRFVILLDEFCRIFSEAGNPPD